jgi:hypothetical protein
MTQAVLGVHNSSHGKGCGDAPVTVCDQKSPTSRGLTVDVDPLSSLKFDVITRPSNSKPNPASRT